MNNTLTTCAIEDLADDPPSVFSNSRIIGDGISNAEYQKQSAKRGEAGYVMSRSDLCEFDTCPSRWMNGYRDDGSDSTRWGSLMDCLVLAPNAFEKRYAVAPAEYIGDDGKPRKWTGNANYCKQWKKAAEDDGKILIQSELQIAAQQACGVLVEDPEIEELLLSSRREVMVTSDYQDKETGVIVPVKCLIDIVPPDSFLADLKTAANAAPRPWQKVVFERDYHTQASLYLDMFNAATNEGRNEFRHIIQENFEPWQVAKRIVSAEFISLGCAKYQRILKRYCECLKSGKWPTYEQAAGNRDVVIDGWLVTGPVDWMLMI